MTNGIDMMLIAFTGALAGLFHVLSGPDSPGRGGAARG